MIMFRDTPISNLKHGTKNIEKVLYDSKNVWIRHDPTFRLTVNSGTDRKFIIPVSGGYSKWVLNKPYAWDIDWGDNTKGTFTGQNSLTTGITHIYPNADVEYVIRITPTNGERGWLKNFGNHENAYTADYNTIGNLDKVKKVEGKIGYYEMSYSNPDGRVAADLFRGFTSLTIGDDFVFFTDDNWFAQEFMVKTFENTGITRLTKQLNLKHIVNSVYTNTSSFISTFGHCKKLTSADPEFELPDLTGEHKYMFSNFLYSTPIELSGTNIKIPKGLIYGDSVFAFFNGSGSTKGGIANFFNGKIFTKAELNKTNAFYSSFSNILTITETLDTTTIPAFTEVPTTANRCFRGSSNTQNVPTQWK